MPDKRIDPYRNYRYRLEIESIQIAGFSQVTIADSTSNPIEYREGTDPNTVRKLSGIVQYGDISLVRGMTSTLDLYKWYTTIATLGTDAAGARKNVSIILVGDDGKDTARWNVILAWPKDYKPGQLDAKGSEVLLETIDLANEGITRVS
jgi:phage tail-like protein